MRVKTGRGLSRESVTHQRSGLLRKITARRVRDAQPKCSELSAVTSPAARLRVCTQDRGTWEQLARRQANMEGVLDRNLYNWQVKIENSSQISGK